MAERSNNGKLFGAMAIILGLASVVLAFVKVYGVYSLVIGALGLINGLIGLMIAKRENSPLGFIKVAIVIAIVGTGMGAFWGFYIMNIMNNNQGKNKSDKVYENIQNNVNTVKPETDEINEDEDEVVDTSKTVVKKPTEENKLDKQLKDYEALINKYISNSKKAKQGDVAALTECTTISVEASSAADEIIKNATSLSERQIKKFEELQKKYDAAVKATEK